MPASELFSPSTGYIRNVFFLIVRIKKIFNCNVNIVIEACRLQKYRLIALVGRVFVNDLGDLCSIPDRVIPETFKMIFDASLFNTQQYKVRIKGKVEQSGDGNSTLPYALV